MKTRRRKKKFELKFKFCYFFVVLDEAEILNFLLFWRGALLLGLFCFCFIDGIMWDKGNFLYRCILLGKIVSRVRLLDYLGE